MSIDIREYIKDLNENFENHLDKDDLPYKVNEEKLKQIKMIIDKAPLEIINELFLGQRRIFQPEDINPDHCEYHEVKKHHIIHHRLKHLQVERAQQMRAKDMEKKENPEEDSPKEEDKE